MDQLIHQSVQKPLPSIQIISQHALPSSTRTTTATLKRKNILVKCFDANAETVVPKLNPYQEIEAYLTSDLCLDDDNEDDGIDVLSFWKDKQNLFPVLSLTAKQISPILASNTGIERLFSAVKNMVTEKRTKLGSEKLNQLLFLQDNFSILQQLNDTSRERTIAIVSITLVYPEESTLTIPKQQQSDNEYSFDNCDDIEGLL